MRWTAISIVLMVYLGAGIIGGCVPLEMEMPDRFMHVDKDDLGPYEVRAISADGVVLACRTQANPSRGSLRFWADAAKNEMTDRQGYSLIDDKAVESDTALPGRLMTFAKTKKGAKLAYMLGVFVKGDRVIIAEAGGRAGAVKPLNADLKAALLSVR